MRQRHRGNTLRLGVILGLLATLLFCGCGAWKSIKQWAGYGVADDVDEPKVPPEAVQEEVVIDGKTWVRSKNPYWLTYPDQPEYIYVEKGREFVGLQGHLLRSLRKKLGLEEGKAKGVPEDRVQELVRKEVERLLREQGIGALYAREKGAPVVGRYVAVLPNPEGPPGLQAANRTLAAAVADQLSRQKDIKVAGPEKVKGSLTAAKITGSLKHSQNLKNLGDALGVQAVVLTDVVPPAKGAPGFLVLEVFDTFLGTKADGIAAPVEGSPTSEAIQRFARDNALRAAVALLNVDWFGRVEFVKEGKVYLSLGQNAGLKVGDRLKVVTPGQEVINPETRASLGFTADQPKGELKVVELLGQTGAVAQVVSGGPFKANDKVKAAR
jgi:hypothetical protein